MNSTGARIGLALATVLALAATAACSDDDGDGLRADTQSIDSSKPSGDGDDASTGDDSGSDDSSGDGDEAGDVLGTAKAQLEAAPLDSTLVPLRIDVVGLEREGEFVELRLRLTNEGADGTPAFEPYSAFTDVGRTDWDLSGAGLVDGEAQKLYLPVVDSADACLCSRSLSEIAIGPGQTVDLNATFGGVPGDLDEVDVRVPNFSSIEGVPVQ